MYKGPATGTATRRLALVMLYRQMESCWNTNLHLVKLVEHTTEETERLSQVSAI